MSGMNESKWGIESRGRIDVVLGLDEEAAAMSLFT
jgi:hypothetical protein